MRPLLLIPLALAWMGGAISTHACGGYGAFPSTYSAHEWGTFTSVVGSDGESIPWNPFVAVDLPGFVYRIEEPLRGDEHADAIRKLALTQQLTKNTTHWLQRMETPVIYFYADAPMSVSATVQFPAGRITEWYPQVSSFGPVAELPGLLMATNLSHLRWDGVLIQSKDAPTDQAFPNGDHPENHYFHARGTDSNPLVVSTPLMTSQEREKGQAEKFLFYRGAGNFETPLAVKFQGEDKLVLENRGSEPLRGIQIFEAHSLAGQLETVDILKPGQTLVVRFAAGKGWLDRSRSTVLLRERLQRSLVAAGLFEREAESMLATWEGDWLGDDGLRILYLLPQPWTETTLPLDLQPKPQSLVRVMVGRTELIRPSVEAGFRNALGEYRSGETNAAIGEIRRMIAARFVEPALSRVDRLERQASMLRLGVTEETGRDHSEFRRESQERMEAIQKIGATFVVKPATASDRNVAGN